MKTVVITNTGNAGYTSSANALGKVSGNSTSFDVTDDKILEEIINSEECVDVISCSGFGIKKFRQLLENPTIAGKYRDESVRFILASDRYYNRSLDGFDHGIVLIMPKTAIDRYISENPDIQITGIPADLVGNASKEDILAAAADFEAKNGTVADLMKSFNFGRAVCLGGRVELEDATGWKENREDIFRKEATSVMEWAKGESFVVTTHGLRTFTDSTRTQDMKPFYAFSKAISEGLAPGQTVMMFVQVALSEITRMPMVLVIENGKERIAGLEGNAYNFVLREIAENSMKVYGTAEQMNLLPELKAVGFDFNDLTPSYWELTVPSNIETYQYVIGKAAEGGEILMAVEQWKEYLQK